MVVSDKLTRKTSTERGGTKKAITRFEAPRAIFAKEELDVSLHDD
jgi:hypothetical protein